MLTSTSISPTQSTSTQDTSSIFEGISTSTPISNFISYHTNFDDINTWPTGNLNDNSSTKLDTLEVPTTSPQGIKHLPATSITSPPMFCSNKQVVKPPK